MDPHSDRFERVIGFLRRVVPQPVQNTRIAHYLGSKLHLGRRRAPREVMRLLTGSSAAQVLTLVTSPFLTRLYSPTDFGIFASFSGVLSLLCIVATLRFEDAIPIPTNDRTALAVVWIALGASLAVGLLATILVFAWGPALARAMGDASLQPLLWLLPVGVMAAGVQSAGIYWTIRKRRFGLLARTVIARSTAQNAIQLSLGFAHLGALGLAAGKIVDKATGIFPLFRALWRNDRQSIRGSGDRNTIVKAVRRYRRFPQLLGPASLITAGSVHLVPVMLLAFYGPQVAGWYALAQRVLVAPLQTVGNSVANVYHGIAPRVVDEHPNRLYQLYMRTAGFLLLAGLGIVGVAAFAGPNIFQVIFGEGWKTAGTYVLLLSTMLVAQLVVQTLKKTLLVVEHHGLRLLWESLHLTLTAVVLLAGHYFEWSHLRTIGVYGLAMTLSYVTLFEAMRRVIRRLGYECEAAGSARAEV